MMGDASEFNGIGFKNGTRRTDQHHHLGSHELFLFLVGSIVDSPGLHVLVSQGG